MHWTREQRLLQNPAFRMAPSWQQRSDRRQQKATWHAPVAWWVNYFQLLVSFDPGKIALLTRIKVLLLVVWIEGRSTQSFAAIFPRSSARSHVDLLTFENSYLTIRQIACHVAALSRRCLRCLCCVVSALWWNHSKIWLLSQKLLPRSVRQLAYAGTKL